MNGRRGDADTEMGAGLLRWHAFLQELAELFGRNWSTVKIALSFKTSLPAQRICPLRRLNALGDDCEPECLANAYDSSHDCRTIEVVAHAGDKAAIYLHRIDLNFCKLLRPEVPVPKSSLANLTLRC